MTDPMLELTEKERRAEEVDQAVMKAARGFNNSLGTPTASLPDGAIAVNELTYWSSLGYWERLAPAITRFHAFEWCGTTIVRKML